MKEITCKNYANDKYYPIVRNAIDEILKEKNYISPIDLFIHCNRLDKKAYEDWRLGKIRYLEKVIEGNLSVLNRFLRIIWYHTKKIGLKESITVYKRWGRGRKSILRFSKSGNSNIERLYSTHYVKVRS